jgi:Rho-binding antiterminator
VGDLKRYARKEIGRCDFIDVLEEAATTHRKVDVELEGGGSRTTHIVDVVTHDGDDFAVFTGGDEVSVTRLESLTEHL